MIYRWRAQFGVGKGKAGRLAALRIADEQHHGVHDARSDAMVLQEMLPKGTKSTVVHSDVI